MSANSSTIFADFFRIDGVDDDLELRILNFEFGGAARNVIIGGYQPNRLDVIFLQPMTRFYGIFDRIGCFPSQRHRFVISSGNVVAVFNSGEGTVFAYAGNEQSVGFAFVQQPEGFGDAIASSGQSNNRFRTGGVVFRIRVDGVGKENESCKPRYQNDDGKYFEEVSHISFCSVRLTV